MTVDNPRVLVAPPLIFVGFVTSGLAIDMHLHEFALPQIFGVLLLIVALLLIGGALNLFRRKRTRPEPWQPATALVFNGVYRFTRNPMYLGMAIAAVAVGFLCQSISAVVLSLAAALVIDRFVIHR